MEKKFFDKGFKLGILGGGQLGRMFIQEAINYNIHVSILDPASNAPCADSAHDFVIGDFNDFDTVLNFGRNMDVVTIEIEHVNVTALYELERLGVKVFPQPKVIELIQDKGLQKEFYQTNNIASSSYQLIDREVTADDLPIVQKLRKGGYDGRGVVVLKEENDLASSFKNAPTVLEKLVDIQKEISVIVARNEAGEIKTFPTVELEFNSEVNLVEFIFSPASVSEKVESEAQGLAKAIADKLDIVGLLAVEMFLTKTGKVLVNEIAPRTHNSGHQSIEGNITSQFEQHLRSIINLPLGDTSITQPSVIVNLLGEPNMSGSVIYEGIEELLATPGAYLHLYGKSSTKPFRKMGHFTVLNPQLNEAKIVARRLKNVVKVVA
jgi:5-(carboxyamino)imidazole ribonucleotide synthase|tara:strand:+ start:30542 stop:31678 length:1137 start_codon:yes stop_codon:yes gene_type:complete